MHHVNVWRLRHLMLPVDVRETASIEYNAGQFDGMVFDNEYTKQAFWAGIAGHSVVYADAVELVACAIYAGMCDDAVNTSDYTTVVLPQLNGYADAVKRCVEAYRDAVEELESFTPNTDSLESYNRGDFDLPDGIPSVSDIRSMMIQCHSVINHDAEIDTNEYMELVNAVHDAKSEMDEAVSTYRTALRFISDSFHVYASECADMKQIAIMAFVELSQWVESGYKVGIQYTESEICAISPSYATLRVSWYTMETVVAQYPTGFAPKAVECNREWVYTADVPDGIEWDFMK
jgi:hypothetical protein